jgi:hypothetical protein
MKNKKNIINYLFPLLKKFIAVITTNISDDYQYNKKTKVLVIDNVKKESILLNLFLLMI